MLSDQKYVPVRGHRCLAGLTDVISALPDRFGIFVRRKHTVVVRKGQENETGGTNCWCKRERGVKGGRRRKRGARRVLQGFYQPAVRVLGLHQHI